jgi:hypothetical protein
VFAKNPALVQRYIKATKADVGGVGGHVVAADEVKSIIAKYVLDNNSYRGEPIFTSMIVTHTATTAPSPASWPRRSTCRSSTSSCGTRSRKAPRKR